KPLYDRANLQWSLVPNLAPTSGSLSLSAGSGQSLAQRYARVFQRVWIRHLRDWEGRMAHPTENMPDYYRETYHIESDASLLMISDVADKQELILHFVQQGIDSYHTALSGQSDRTLSKWPIVFAGMLLNHNGMRTVSYGGFREVWQTYYGGPGWTGATVLFRVKVGMEHE